MTLPGRPIVLIDRPCLFPAMPLWANSREGARVLVEHLITVHGHQSIPLITGGESAQILASKDGDAFQSHGLPPGPIMRTNFSYRGG